MMRGALPNFCPKLLSAVFALGVIAVPFSVLAQTVTITDVPEAENGTIVLFTPGAQPPVTKPVQVTAQTTGAVTSVQLGLNGSLLGVNNWTGPASSTMFPEGGGQWSGTIDLALEPNITPNAINAFTLRAFAFTGVVSGYDASSQVRATISDFDTFDAEQIFLDIRDSNLVDPDQNGIPNASALSNVAPSNGGPVDFQVTPDPDDPDDPNDPDYNSSYIVQRRVQSLNQGISPNFIIVNKQMVIRFQLYDIAISTPNLAWFKANFSGIPLVSNATNAVMVIRSESNPRFIVDNFPENPVVDPALAPRLNIIDEFNGENVPFAFISLTVLMETTPGTWTELNLAETAPLFIQVRSVQMNGASKFQVSRYSTTGVQSTFDGESLYVVGDATGWTQLNENRVSNPSFNGNTTSITISESVRSATYGIYFKRGGGGGGNGDGGGGGGGGGCFVATAAYGTPLANEVDSLRHLRDEHLLNSALGSAFVDTYYRVSPALANMIAERPVLRSIARVLLTPVVALAGSASSAGLVTGLALCGLLAGAGMRRRARATQRINGN